MPPQLTVIEVRYFSSDDRSGGMWVGQRFDLVEDRVSFGRSPENSIPLFSLCKARHQGQLVREGGDYYIEDLPGTVFRTLVNNTPIAGRTLLRDGDVISVFGVRLLYRTDTKAE